MAERAEDKPGRRPDGAGWAVSVPRPDPLPRDVTGTLGRPKPTGATRGDPDRQRGRAGPMTAPSGSVAGRSASRGCFAGSNRASSV